jgi:hypothetical protein
MHANAKFVSEGAMGYINAEEFYKEVRGGFLSQRERGARTSCRAGFGKKLAKEKTLTIY